MNRRFWLGAALWQLGACQSTSCGVYLTDRYGSLDGYIEHLRSPGTWVQVPVWMPIAACLGFQVLAVVVLLSLTESRATYPSRKEGT